MNIFGRFLQSSPVASSEKPGQSMPSTIDLLLVDNDLHDLDMAELLLKQRDDRLMVTTATSAAGGLEILESNSIDCVVSDYDMPGTDGIEFLKKVRKQHAELPFILFTGQGSEKIAKSALLSDVNDYVEKDIGKKQYDILIERIQKAIY
jgi:Response regulator containing CheY-like receiver, AAA-type ATPase, and DNA-binding domains